eukprot:gene20547-22568_t
MGLCFRNVAKDVSFYFSVRSDNTNESLEEQLPNTNESLEEGGLSRPDCLNARLRTVSATLYPLMDTMKPTLFEESTCLLTENASSITITWIKNYLEDDDITGYIIKYRSKGTQKWNNASVVAPVTPTVRFTLDGLKPYTFWEFQVIAFNHPGNSLFLQWRNNFSVGNISVPGQPINVSAVPQSSKSIQHFSMTHEIEFLRGPPSEPIHCMTLQDAPSGPPEGSKAHPRIQKDNHVIIKGKTLPHSYGAVGSQQRCRKNRSSRVGELGEACVRDKQLVSSNLFRTYASPYVLESAELAAIVIYSMLERIKNEQTVDTYDYVTMLRSQTNFMVQNDEQYIFVHDAILDAIQSGSTAVSTSEFSTCLMKTMSEFNKHGDVLIERDFNSLITRARMSSIQGTFVLTLSTTLQSQSPGMSQSNKADEYEATFSSILIVTASGSKSYKDASGVEKTGVEQRREADYGQIQFRLLQQP